MDSELYESFKALEDTYIEVIAHRKDVISRERVETLGIVDPGSDRITKEMMNERSTLRLSAFRLSELAVANAKFDIKYPQRDAVNLYKRLLRYFKAVNEFYTSRDFIAIRKDEARERKERILNDAFTLEALADLIYKIHVRFESETLSKEFEKSKIRKFMSNVSSSKMPSFEEDTKERMGLDIDQTPHRRILREGIPIEEVMRLEDERELSIWN